MSTTYSIKHAKYVPVQYDMPLGDRRAQQPSPTVIINFRRSCGNMMSSRPRQTPSRSQEM